MKKIKTLLLAGLLVTGLLSGCGNNVDQDTAQDVDLNAFYDTLAQKYDWDENYLGDVDGDLLENYYPGLGEVYAKQLVAKAPMMSAVVKELVFIQCGSDTDADKAEEILQKRIADQVGDDTNPGGAWYPESIESWKKAAVLRHGDYVALIATADYQTEVEDAFNQLFA